MRYTILVAIVLSVLSCSTNKNTPTTRTFHNVTSKYNILFNGTESYEKGMLNLQKNYKDDYSQLIPIFLYHDENALGSISSEMDRAIKKATKIISLHSITIKPEYDDDEELTEKDREFLNKNEYNKWVDEAYLLMGKANFYKLDYSKASETFQYILTNYPDENTVYEARIWQARLALIKNRLKEAAEILTSLEKDLLFPKKLSDELHTTLAELSLKRDEPRKAITYLEKVVDETHNRYYKQRFHYILGQLYNKQKQSLKAIENFEKVVKLNPPYEMTFNSQINMALSYQGGTVARRDVEKQLHKMLKDDKNIEFRDQIYYAWGNLYFKDNNIDKALEYYHLSAETSAGNQSQQIRTFLTIADIYYEKPKYIPAQSYYDSAVAILTPDYPNYKILLAKSTSLTNLVTNLNTVELEDSLQALAKMSRPEINQIIADIIENEKELEKERQRKEQLDNIQRNLAEQQQFELQTNDGNTWYFYNSSSLTLGRQAFKKIWGNRPLEDNWRRKNKAALSFDIGNPMAENAVENMEEIVNTAVGGKYNPETYLANIPFSDSALEASHAKVENSLFEIGNVYGGDLKDFDKAEHAYKEMLSRYPTTDKKLQAYYKLYAVGKESGNEALAQSYLQKIVVEFPNSNYAKILSDPLYAEKQKQKELRIQNYYNQVYNEFERGNHSKVVNMGRIALEEYSEHDLYPQFDYMYTVSSGTFKDTVAFIEDLKQLATRYADLDLAQSAQQLISFLTTVNPVAAKQQIAKEVQSIFKDTPSEDHFILVAVKKGKNANQLEFNLFNFNLDNYEDAGLTNRKDVIGDYQCIIVSKFKNDNDASKYLQNLNIMGDVWRDVDRNGSASFFISRTNFGILRSSGNIEQYITYFTEKYR